MVKGSREFEDDHRPVLHRRHLHLDCTVGDFANLERSFIRLQVGPDERRPQQRRSSF